MNLSADAESRVTAGPFEAATSRALDFLGPQRALDFASDYGGLQKKSLDVEVLRRAAEGRGLEVTPLGRTFSLFRGNELVLGFYQNMCWTLSALDRFASNDKQLTKRILKETGLPVADGEVVETLDEALRVFKRIGESVVVKPLRGSGGRGVTVDVRTETQLSTAFAYAKEYSRQVLVEECVPSIDLRVMVADGQAVAATMRVPAHIVGDGHRSVAELVAEKNAVRARNPYHRASLIELTPDAIQRLDAKGMSADSVPTEGQRVFLHYKANISSGGDGIDVTDRLHPGIMRLAEHATASFETAHHAGVDILVERLDLSPAEQRCIICEINCNNDIPMHEFPYLGEPVPSGDREIAGYFFGERSKALRRPANRLGDTRSGERQKPLRRLVGFGSEQDFNTSDWMVEKLATRVRGDATSVMSRSPRDIDKRSLQQALATHGWEDVRYERKLVLATVSGRRVVAERCMSSVFAARLPTVRPAFEEALSQANIPYCRRVALDREAFASAKEFIEKHPGPWTVRAENDKLRIRLASGLRRGISVERAWRRIGKRTERIVIEQTSESHGWRLLVVAGQIVACLALCPPAVVGDGESTVAELVEHNAELRRANPYLYHFPMPRSVPTKSRLANVGFSSGTVLQRGSVLELDRTTRVASGAETVAYGGSIPAAVRLDLETLLNWTGHPQVAAVTFALRREGYGKPTWAVSDFDVDPLLAEFAWAAAGDVADVYKRVADRLVVSQCYELGPIG